MKEIAILIDKPKIMVMLQNVCENCVRILEEEKHRQLGMFVILWEKVKETDILIDKPKIMVMLQKVCENCVQILEEEKQRQLRMYVILWKKWKKVAYSSINQKSW